ncbi:MAG TPA: hypothetical protein VHO84_15180 [Syntrophorhabdaceae bacterium]|nr:hypothetical protein [Syntrophorhabdaceae bacterium]
MSDTEKKQSGEGPPDEETMQVSSNQISAVINVYMKNLRAQLGIDKKVQHVSKEVERHISKYNLEDIIHDRITREKRKLKKS